MGFLEFGVPVEWPFSLFNVEYIRNHGVLQFINTYNRVKDTKSPLLWGDEIEYHLVKISKSSAQIALIAPELIQKLKEQDDLGKLCVFKRDRNIHFLLLL